MTQSKNKNSTAVSMTIVFSEQFNTLIHCDFLDKSQIALNVNMNERYFCYDFERKFKILKESDSKE